MFCRHDVVHLSENEYIHTLLNKGLQQHVVDKAGRDGLGEPISAPSAPSQDCNTGGDNFSISLLGFSNDCASDNSCHLSIDLYDQIRGYMAEGPNNAAFLFPATWFADMMLLTPLRMNIFIFR